MNCYLDPTCQASLIFPIYGLGLGIALSPRPTTTRFSNQQNGNYCRPIFDTKMHQQLYSDWNARHTRQWHNFEFQTKIVDLTVEFA
jgi:hypothetical protein